MSEEGKLIVAKRYEQLQNLKIATSYNKYKGVPAFHERSTPFPITPTWHQMLPCQLCWESSEIPHVFSSQLKYNIL